MEEFWIVCKWDDYYPNGGISNIVLVTEDYECALSSLRAWEEDARNYYFGGSSYHKYVPDNCKIYSSHNLPWVNEVGLGEDSL